MVQIQPCSAPAALIPSAVSQVIKVFRGVLLLGCPPPVVKERHHPAVTALEHEHPFPLPSGGTRMASGWDGKVQPCGL